MFDAVDSRARYRRILRFAGRYIVQAWWYELFLPRIGLGGLSARGRGKRLETIAKRCGFTSAEILRRLFQRRLGVSPTSYRKRFRSVR